MSLLNTLGLRRLVEGAVDLLFPANCLGCQTDLSEEADRIGFCTVCRKLMLRGDEPVCSRCASPVPAIPGDVPECIRCREQKLWFDQTLALGSYDAMLRAQALIMKTDRTERLALALGQMMAAQFGERLREQQLDGIVSVPMHAWRRLARGTNPPAALASTLGRELGLPVFSGLLQRRHNTQPQIGLSQPARFRNVRNEMQVRASFHLASPHVLLVDDILTTGATCSEAARILKQAGAARVTVVVAARTPKD